MNTIDLPMVEPKLLKLSYHSNASGLNRNFDIIGFYFNFYWLSYSWVSSEQRALFLWATKESSLAIMAPFGNQHSRPWVWAFVRMAAIWNENDVALETLQSWLKYSPTVVGDRRFQTPQRRDREDHHGNNFDSFPDIPRRKSPIDFELSSSSQLTPAISALRVIRGH